jgi:hypothetical protein
MLPQHYTASQEDFDLNYSRRESPKTRLRAHLSLNLASSRQYYYSREIEIKYGRNNMTHPITLPTLLQPRCVGDQFKEDELVVTCNIHGVHEKCTQNFTMQT